MFQGSHPALGPPAVQKNIFLSKNHHAQLFKMCVEGMQRSASNLHSFTFAQRADPIGENKLTVYSVYVNKVVPGSFFHVFFLPQNLTSIFSVMIIHKSKHYILCSKEKYIQMLCNIVSLQKIKAIHQSPVLCTAYTHNNNRVYNHMLRLIFCIY